VEYRRHEDSGTLCKWAAGSVGRGDEPASGGTRVRAGAQDDAQDARVLGTTGLPAAEAGAAAEVRPMAGCHRRDSGRRQATSAPSSSFDAVRHLVLCRIERRPPRLDMANWPHLPLARVCATRAADYMSLLSIPTAEPPRLEATL